MNYKTQLKQKQWGQKRDDISFQSNDSKCIVCNIDLFGEQYFKAIEPWVKYTRKMIMIETVSEMDKIPISEFTLPNKPRKHKDEIFNLHHKFYIKGRLAWDYPDWAYALLHQECHKELHIKNKVNVYTEKYFINNEEKLRSKYQTP